MNAPDPQPADTNANRRRFQYSLRSLFVFMIAASLVLAWFGPKVRQWVDEWNQEAIRRAAYAKRRAELARIEALGGRVYEGCGWVRGGVYVIFKSPPATDKTLAELKKLIPIEGLQLAHCPISDAGLKDLQGQRLMNLDLAGTMVTDAGLKQLQGVQQLEHLELSDTKISDAGLEYLTNLKHLQSLNLAGTRCTEKGVKKLQLALPDCKIEWNE